MGSCEVIVSDSMDNHIDWHTDYNLYQGKRYTFILTLESNNGQSLEIRDGSILKYIPGLGVIFDDNTFHRVNKPTQKGRRIVLSFSYITNDKIDWIKYLKRLPQTLLYKYYALHNFNYSALYFILVIILIKMATNE